MKQICLLIGFTLCFWLTSCDQSLGSNHQIKSDTYPVSIPGTLSLIAGNIDGPGYTDGPALSARFGEAHGGDEVGAIGIASDESGNLYVADTSNHVIRKLNKSGDVTTIAGKAGSPGSVDGIGAEARFNHPTGIAVDKEGALYVTDSVDCTVRKITPSGVVSTVAGKSGEQGANDGEGRAARFRQPKGIAVSAKGVVYVADTANNAIREISTSGMVKTLAGSVQKYGFLNGSGTSALFTEPEGIAVDRFGTIYVSDFGNQAIRRITPQGVVDTIFNNTPSPSRVKAGASSATPSISYPRAIGMDSLGNLYVIDNNGFHKISAGGVVNTIDVFRNLFNNEESALLRQFTILGGVAVDKTDNVYVVVGSLIRKINSLGNVTTVAGQMEKCGNVEGSSAREQFCGPTGLATDKQGNLYVSDHGRSVIRKVDPTGLISTLAGKSYSHGDSLVQRYSDGWGSSAEFSYPTGIVADGVGNLYACDTENHVIRKITPDGTVTTVAGVAGQKGWADGTGSGALFSEPLWIAIDKQSNLYVVDAAGKTVRKIDRAGVVTTIAGYALENGHSDGNGADARFGSINGLTIDPTGNLYVTDRAAIRKISPSGTVSTIGDYSIVANDVGSADSGGDQGNLYYPKGIASDEMGNIYYSVHSKIREINSSGDVIAEVNVSTQEGAVLGNLNSLNKTRSLTFFDRHTMLLTSRNAVLKLKLP